MQKWAAKTILTVTLMALPVCVLAFQNQPLGFRGIRWGAGIGTLTDTKIYVKENEKKKIGKASLENISYIFCFDELEGVVIGYESGENHEILKKTFFEA